MSNKAKRLDDANACMMNTGVLFAEVMGRSLDDTKRVYELSVLSVSLSACSRSIMHEVCPIIGSLVHALYNRN